MSERMFYSIREVARMGFMSEHCIRQMVKRGDVPCIYSGTKCLINLDLFKKKLQNSDSPIYEVKR